MGYGYYYDPTYILVLIGAIICIWASVRVNRVMKKYSKVRNMAGISGAEAAQRILSNEGLYDVRIECLSANDGDHYDPSSKTVRLSYDNYHNATVTSVAVAAHECGHAIQHAKEYAPLQFRTALVPVVNIGSKIGIPIIILGMILSWNYFLIQLGIWIFALSVLFQIVTLPVEFNASSRALAKIDQYGLLGTQEAKGGKKVLSAAAMTYVAAAASSILQLLRLILLSGNRRRD